ncbi:MAG: hypothetical protein QOI36_4395, partial [Pseudonocardiales bacterium]|nr:hypothetical protein [Pseudonocardiales bacterium]
MTRLLLRIAPAVAALLLLVALGAPATAAAQDELSKRTPYVVHTRTSAEAGAAADVLEVRPTVTFDHVFAGFAASLTRAQVDRLHGLAGVLAVEEDRRLNALEPRAVRDR